MEVTGDRQVGVAEQAVGPGLREMPGFTEPYLHCRTYRATIPIRTCLNRQAPNIKLIWTGHSAPETCPQCVQGEAVREWASSKGITVNMPKRRVGGMKKKVLKTAVCANCARTMKIKALGFCATCYETPHKKGYKQGSREWIACQAELRQRMDPLFSPKMKGNPIVQAIIVGRKEKVQEALPTMEDLARQGAVDCPSQQWDESSPAPEKVTEEETKPATLTSEAHCPWLKEKEQESAQDKPEVESLAQEPEAGQEGKNKFFDKTDGYKIAFQTGPALEQEAKMRITLAEDDAFRDTYISLFFDKEESLDMSLYSWLRAKAHVNRRGTAAEVLSLLEGIVNREESAKAAVSRLAGYSPKPVSRPADGSPPPDFAGSMSSGGKRFLKVVIIGSLVFTLGLIAYLLMR